MDTEDKGGQWIQWIKADRGYRETVDIVDTNGQWIQRIQVDSEYRGYRRTVDTEDTCGQWIQRNSRYNGCTQLKISEFSADPCKNSNVNNEDPHSKNKVRFRDFASCG